MADLEQAIEQSVFDEVLLNPEKADQIYASALTEETTRKARQILHSRLKNYSNFALEPIYDKVMEELLDEFTVKGNEIVPAKIAGALEENQREYKLVQLLQYLELFDKSIKEHNNSLNELEIKERTAKLKKYSVDEREKKITKKLDELKQKSTENIEQHEKTKLESDIERLEAEISRIKEQKAQLEKKATTILPIKKEKLANGSTVGVYYNKVYALAQELELAHLLKLNLPRKTGELDCRFDYENLVKKSSLSIYFPLMPVVKEPRKPMSKKIKALIAGVVAGLALMAGIGYSIIREKPKPMPTSSNISHLTNKKYMPGHSKIKSFDKDKMELHLEYLHAGQKTGLPYSIALNPLRVNLDDDKADFASIDYDKLDGAIREIRVKYALYSDGKSREVGRTKPRIVPRKEIKDYVRKFVQKYEHEDLHKADIILEEGIKIQSARYQATPTPGKAEIILGMSSPNYEVKLVVDKFKFSSNRLDKLPECYFCVRGQLYYLDVTPLQVKLLKPKPGQQIEEVQLTAYRSTPKAEIEIKKK
ncbi:hypothetical protein KY312_01185 [Candidatus Woesearchaeota archaeon]|nr:hypothetical protein [Candidatus Woesearchaeota archaeon]